MSNVLKWIGYFILGIIALVFIPPLSPILIIISLIAWFFFSRRGDERKKKYAKYATIASAIGLAIFPFIDSSTETDDAAPADEQTEVVEEVENEEPTSSVEEDTTETEEEVTSVEEKSEYEEEQEQKETSASEDTASVEETTESEEESTEPEEENTESEPASDNKFEAAASDVFGERVQDVYVDEAGEATEHYVGITADLGSGWSEQTMRDGFYFDVVDVLEQVQNEEFDRIVFNGTAEMQDQYGNVEEMRVLTINLTKDTVDKINFDNFIADNLPDVADAVFIHPAFQD